MRNIFAALLVLMSASAWADTSPTGGRVEVRDGDLIRYLPTVHSDYDVRIAGDLATVTVTQSFRNNLGKPVHASYLFPLDADAAVFAMTMEVGDEVIRAKIDRIQEAKKTFEQAKVQGKSAALLEQHRPNMFTQKIANLAPDAPVTIRLKYTQTVRRTAGEYELVLPLVVGPRYRSASVMRSTEQSARAAVPRDFRGWELEALPDVADPVIEKAPVNPNHTVDIRVALDGALPITQVHSDTHRIRSTWVTETIRSITLNDTGVIDNRDFVLRYSLAGESVQAGFIAHQDKRGGFFSLLIEPPEVVGDQVAAREMVFVLDCSGSMSGAPLEASKIFVTKALRQLRPADTFRIIRFSEHATEFSRAPLAATPRNIMAGMRYVDQLNSGGGTEMTQGILQALKVPVPDNTVRLVTFLTDGYIGEEHRVLSLVDEHLGTARLFALGVGAATNRYLLGEMGIMGRGFVQYLDPTGDVEETTTMLAARLQSPVLTDISVDWGDMVVSDIYPQKIPDLFSGQSVRVQGRYTGSGSRRIRVNGTVAGEHASLPVAVDLVDESSGETGAGNPAVALVWARSAVADTMRGFHSAGRSATTDELKERVTNLGLMFDLVTKWTTFVAVSERVYNNNPADTPDAAVASRKVAGVSSAAYGANTQFVGTGAPEPGTWLLIATLFALLAAAFGGGRGTWRQMLQRRWHFDMQFSADANFARDSNTLLNQQPATEIRKP